jgi:hypothetical protein
VSGAGGEGLRLASIGFFLLALGSGLVSGFIVGRSDTARRPGDVPSRVEIVDGLQQEVGLDAEQRARVEKIYHDNHGRFVTVRARIEPELAAIRSDVRAQMRACLREEQLAPFDAYCAARDKRHASETR